jgi:hypothetical protein
MKKILAILSFLFLHSSLAVAQCAMCRGAVQSNMSNGRNAIGNGINTGILYLFVFPYLIVGVIGYLWYTNSKKALAKRIAIRERVRQAYNQ